jgi:ADP-ribose pyrophosphatase YjhB (NUDIX family)
VSSLERRYPERPIVGVGAVVLVDAAHPGVPRGLTTPAGVVLVRRRNEPLADQWSLPGGILELGEQLVSGVAREVREETGLIVEVGALVEIVERIELDDEQRVRHHYVLIDYLCRATGGELRAGSDASEVVIADPRTLQAFHVTEMVEIVVGRAMQMA